MVLEKIQTDGLMTTVEAVRSKLAQPLPLGYCNVGVVANGFGADLHILFLTDNFSLESNAPASRTFEHCREWVRADHDVTVITCAPNFPKGKVFGGYRNRLWQQEQMDGIRVIRVWSYITANEGFC